MIQSPAAKGLDSYIPGWVTPPLDSPVYAERTFVHPDWILPVLILFLVMIINQAARLSFGYVMFRITSDIEQLPFPLEPVQARGVTALAETSAKAEGWRWPRVQHGNVYWSGVGIALCGCAHIVGHFSD